MAEQLATKITITLSYDGRSSSQNSNPKRLEDKLKALQFSLQELNQSKQA